MKRRLERLVVVVPPLGYNDRARLLDTVVRSGANVINIHHATEHNPYINYPFIANEKLAAYCREAHAKNVKVKIYYTVRELSHRQTINYRVQGQKGLVCGAKVQLTPVVNCPAAPNQPRDRTLGLAKPGARDPGGGGGYRFFNVMLMPKLSIIRNDVSNAGFFVMASM